MIRDKLLQHLTENNLLSNYQHGFRPGRTCNTQLVKVLDQWSRMLEEHSPLDVVYFGLSKNLRFGSTLSTPLQAQMLWNLWQASLMDSILLDRTETAGGPERFLFGLDWIDVACRVPQGTVLGPLLFLVYINDLPDAVQCPL